MKSTSQLTASNPRKRDVVLGARSPFPLVQDDEKYLVLDPTANGRLLQVVFVVDPNDTVFVIHARPLPGGKEALPKEDAVKKKSESKRRRYGRMTASGLAEATTAYGREMAIDDFRPLSEESLKRWEKARRKPGRPRRGKGVKVISVSVEQDLLFESDRLARRLGVSRARLIERGLRVILEGAGK
jgi:hypothetical protein